MVINREKYCREFHTERYIYQLEVDVHSFYVVFKLPDETLYSDNFKFFADHSTFLKKYENGLVYKWLARVLASIELDTRALDEWTDFSV